MGLKMESQIIEKLEKIEGKVEERLKKLDNNIRNLISTIEDETYRCPKFLESSPAERTFGKKVKGILDNILQSGGAHKTEILITGYFDHAIVDRLKEILAQKGKLKLISPTGKQKGGGQHNLDALYRIEEKGGDVRVHPMLHARIFYLIRDNQPWGVIIGSGDLKSDCLGGRRFDASIYSNHPEIIKSTIDFFNRVWKDRGTKKLNDLTKRGKP